MKKPPPDAAWAAEIADVRPLGSKKPATPALPKMPEPTGTTPLVIQRPIAGWNTHQPVPILSNTAECIAGQVEGLEKNILKDLAGGKIRPTAILDLHGLGEGDAWLELVDFLHTAADADHRAVIVVHGKGHGYGPQRNMGVIKFQIGTWLAGHPKVLAFHTAIPHDGGTGAIYVYLKRHRYV